jgi:hypothetical protein
MLSLGIRASGGGCGGACPNVATTFQVFAVTDDWDHGTVPVGDPGYEGAGWCHRKQTVAGDGVAWQMAGAEGTDDRSSVALATIVVDAQTATMGGAFVAPLDLGPSQRTELLARMAGTRLSLILVRTSGGPLFLTSLESGKTSLAITTCE